MTVSDLLISEVMANPAALSDTRGEWFELYNPTTEAINLHEITIGDDGNDRHRIESDLLILPGEYLTLARYLDPGFNPDYVYDDFTLGNSDDEIVFSDEVSELLRLEYGSDFDAAGRSRELVGLPMIEANYDLTLASLTYGLGDIGTPGAAGSTSFAPSAVPIPAAAWLFISGLLALFSLSSRSSPRSFPSSPNFLSSSPRKRGSHN
ncbi:MAG: lamin tail domain-containing protein, partial [Gammaproteobacteria bacterium]